MLFSQNHDTEEDLAIWKEVSFDCSKVFHIVIESHVDKIFASCVCDVDYAFIMIPRPIKRVMVGPLRIINY